MSTTNSPCVNNFEITTSGTTQIEWFTNVIPWPRMTNVNIMEMTVLPKPVIKNKSVEKKIKRRGWCKQFYEK